MNIYYSIAVAVLVAVLGWLVGRFSIKTKQEIRNDDHEERIQKLETALPLLLKCHNAQLIAMKRGHVNGELDEVLAELNDYLFHK